MTSTIPGREIPVAGAIGTVDNGPRGADERLQEDWDEMTSKPPVGEIKLPWYVRLHDFVQKAYTAIMAGIADAKSEAPQESKSHKFWDIVYKILTLAAGIFGLKKL